MFMDKSKEPTGECTVTYENPESAARAIEMFHGKEFNGANLSVQIATPEQKQPFANKLVSSHYLNASYIYFEITVPPTFWPVAPF